MDRNGHIKMYYISFIIYIMISPIVGGFINDIYEFTKKQTICRTMECCNDDWLIKNIPDLHHDLLTKVFGQHIVHDVIINSLKDHLNNPNPQKALTMSFHGWPGNGKNYITEFIVKHMYFKGFDSKYVHMFSAQIHFPSKNKIDQYKEDLKTIIKNSVSSCATSMFIFDEVDKMPAGVLNVIKPIIDNFHSIDKIDYRKSIFVFLSNTGGSLIGDHMKYLWKQGIKRENLKMAHFESLIKLGAFNEDGGFQKSDAIESNLIDHYIPFLPLEHDHVKKCILNEFRLRHINNPTDDAINEVMESVQFDQDLKKYATTGCKRISQKVGLIAMKKPLKKSKYVHSDL